MPSHSNPDTLRAFYACFEHEDYVERVKVFLAPDVIWHVAGSNPLAGDFRGVAAVTDQMLRYSERSGGTLHLDTSIMASDSHVVAVHHATAARREFEYNAHEIDVFHVDQGRITEFWSFSEDQEATDRMWS